MSDTFAQFEKRLDTLERKHRELAKGYVAKINPDGLITVEPKRERGLLRPRFALAVIVGFLLFKIVTLAAVGPLTYQDRIAALADGTAFEKVCAWIMQADTISLAAAEYLIKVFS
ncbi:MAG: hypothetical protein AAF665_03715 [Pseudomonadota bacterium]